MANHWDRRRAAAPNGGPAADVFGDAIMPSLLAGGWCGECPACHAAETLPQWPDRSPDPPTLPSVGRGRVPAFAWRLRVVFKRRVEGGTTQRRPVGQRADGELPQWLAVGRAPVARAVVSAQPPAVAGRMRGADGEAGRNSRASWPQRARRRNHRHAKGTISAIATSRSAVAYDRKAVRAVRADAGPGSRGRRTAEMRIRRPAAGTWDDLLDGIRPTGSRTARLQGNRTVRNVDGGRALDGKREVVADC
jgi:hypothetical protein